MKKSKIGIVVLLLVLAVGFAAVSTTLVLNGTAIFGTNDDDFDVIFTKSIIDGVDVSSTTISEDGKSITFETSDLAKADDESVLNFTVTNNSTQYDANVTMECIAEGTNADYYEITNTIPSVIVAKTSESGSVTARLKKVSVNEIHETFTCTITANAVERTEEGIETSVGPFYAFGLPTIASTTDYRTLGYNVFVRLGTDNSLGICINDNGLLCLKNNDYENSVVLLKKYFGEDNCYSANLSLRCDSGLFNCGANSNGNISCYDNAENTHCIVYSDGIVTCS